VYTLTRAAHPGRKDLEGPRTRREALFGRPRRGAVKPIAAESTGGTSPRGRPPMGETNGANPFVARERSPVGVCVVVATRFGPSVRGARTRRKVRTTLETRRTTYPPAQASSTPARERWTTRAHRTKRKPLKGSTSGTRASKFTNMRCN
jgi:hypothetical protein